MSSFIAAGASKRRSEAVLKFSAVFWKLKFEESHDVGTAGKKCLGQEKQGSSFGLILF